MDGIHNSHDCCIEWRFHGQERKTGLLLLALGGWLFAEGWLNAVTLTLVWTVVFFFASPAASAAYLTVAECFPLEVRALAIALFYALGTGLGGIAGPLVFGQLIGTGNAWQVFAGYLFGSALMIGAAIVELAIGVKAENHSLETVAPPLASVVQSVASVRQAGEIAEPR